MAALLSKLLSKLAPKIIKKTGQEPAKKWTKSEIKNKAVWKQIEKIIDPSPKDLSTKKARMAVTAQQKGALQAAEGIDKSNPNRAEIIKLTRESIGESSPRRRLTDVDELGRPLSNHIPPWDESVKDRTGFKKAVPSNPPAIPPRRPAVEDLLFCFIISDPLSSACL